MTTENEQVVEPPSSAPAEPSAAPAAPTPAPAGEERQPTVLEAVKGVMEKGRAAEAAAAQGAAASAQAPAKPDAQGAQPPAAAAHKPEAAKEDGRLTNEEFKALPEKAQRRFGALYREAQTYKQNYEKAAPLAKHWNELEHWCQNAGITTDEFNFGLTFVAEVRNNPMRALEMLQPTLTALQRHAGEVLPQDLQAEVDAGSISKERARELAKERAERARLEQAGRQRDVADQNRAAEEEERQAREAHVRITETITRSIAGYEGQWKASDPDYPKKMARVKSEFFSRMDERRRAGNPVSTPQDAVELLKAARKDVEDWMQGFLPKPAPKDPLPAGGAGAQTRIEPQSPLEAVRLGLAKFKVPAAA